MLCMRDQQGRMHSKPNLSSSQQGKNEKERKSKEKDYHPRILNDTSEQHIKIFFDNCPLSRNESLDI